MNESHVHGNRDVRGDWTPELKPKVAPIFSWPIRMKEILKFLAGYLWPWNTLYAGLALVTWLYLTPSQTSTRMFEIDWVAFLFVRNAALTILVAGGWHLWLYILRRQGTDYKYNIRWPSQGKTFLFSNQILDNVFRTFSSAVPIWTLYEAVLLWVYSNGYIPLLTWNAHPVYFILLMLALPLFRDTHFYFTHRLLHWPPLYKLIHHVHHKNANPGPWSGLAMHPIEHAIYFSSALIHLIIPSHPVHFIFHLQQLGLTPAQGHVGFERVVVNDEIAMPTHDYYHYLHHKYFECNYSGGDGSLPFDKWFGTYNDGTPEMLEQMNKRFMAKRSEATGK